MKNIITKAAILFGIFVLTILFIGTCINRLSAATAMPTPTPRYHRIKKYDKRINHFGFWEHKRKFIDVSPTVTPTVTITVTPTRTK